MTDNTTADNTTADTDLATSLTDQIGALNEENVSLLIESVLHRLQLGLEQMPDEPSALKGHAAVLTGLIGLAGYANAHQREAKGFTSTGDTRVEAVFKTYRALVEASVNGTLGMSPDDEERVSAAVKRAEARVTSEHITDSDTVSAILREEVSKEPGLIDKFEFEVVKADADGPDTDTGYGLYL